MTMLAAQQQSTSEVEWRRLGRFLWAGRLDGRPLGTIEHGRRYVLTDAGGEHAGRYRSLADAQRAAVEPSQRAALQVDGRRVSAIARGTVLSLVLGGGVALGSTALAAMHLV